MRLHFKKGITGRKWETPGQVNAPFMAMLEILHLRPSIPEVAGNAAGRSVHFKDLLRLSFYGLDVMKRNPSHPVVSQS